jgi:hypothetical protein
MKKFIKTLLLFLVVLMLVYSNLSAQDVITQIIPPVKDQPILNKTLNPDVVRKYIIFNNLDYYVDTCYIATLRAHPEYSQDYTEMPFTDATFNQIKITDYDVAIFPVGNSGPGFVQVPPSYGNRYALNSGTGKTKIIDKIMEMINAGKGVIVIAQNALWGNAQANDPDVTNFVKNIMGIDYQGKYKCGEVTSSGSSTEWKWWMFKIVGVTGDPVGYGLPKYFNGGDYSSGESIQPLAYFMDVDWFYTKDPNKYFLTDVATFQQSDSGLGIRSEYFLNETDRSRIVFWSPGFEGYGGRWEIKKNMMWQAMRWVLDETFKPGPEIQAIPNTLNFHGVDVGKDKTMTITLKHTGIETLEISKIELDYFFAEPEDSKAFTITKGGLVEGKPTIKMQPGDEHPVDIKFKPDIDKTPFTISLQIESNAKTSPSLALDLKGYGGEEVPDGGKLVAVNEVNFGNVEKEGGKVLKELNIANGGNISMFVSVYLPDSTSDNKSFDFFEPVNNPTTLDAGKDFNVKLNFFPLSENTNYHGKVIIHSNALNVSSDGYIVNLVGHAGIWTDVPEKGVVGNGLFYFKTSPNPFADITRIKYNLTGTNEQKVEMSVVDLLGNKMFDLVNGYIYPGENWLDLSSSKLTAGTYYLISKVAGSTAVLPIVIVK